MPSTRPNQKFTPGERLKLRKRIELLFQNGSALNEFPVQIVYIKSHEVEEANIQVAFSVSKRLFKNAVDRIRIKRLMREAYRTQSNSLKEVLINKNSTLYLMFIYKSDKEVPYQEVAEKIFLLLQRLEKIIAQK